MSDHNMYYYNSQGKCYRNRYYKGGTIEENISIDDAITATLWGLAILGLLGAPGITALAATGIYIRAASSWFNRPAWDSLSDLKRR